VAARPWIPAELKHRPFSTQEARAAGVSETSLRGNSWRRLGRGLYCWAGLRLDHWDRLAGWHRCLVPDAVFIGLTAAWLHHLDVDPHKPIEVAVSPDSGARSRRGLVVRHLALSAEEITKTRGLPVTTTTRTFSDLRSRLSRVEYLVLADQALKLDLGRFDELAEPAESPMETRLRWLLREAGLPPPLVQVDLHDGEGRFVARADLYYPAARLVIEYDGTNHRERLVEDDRRQNQLQRAGFRLLRFTAADLLQRPETVTALVHKMLLLSD